MEFNPNRSHSTASNNQVPNKLSPQPSRIEQNAQKHPAPLEHYASTGSNHLAQAGSKPLSDFSISSSEKKAEETAKDPSTDTRLFIREILSTCKLFEPNSQETLENATTKLDLFVQDFAQDMSDEQFDYLTQEAKLFLNDLNRFFRYRTTLNTIQSKPINNEQDLVELQTQLNMLEGVVKEPKAEHTFFTSVWEEFTHFRDSMHALKAAQEKLKSIESNPPKTIQHIEALAPSLKKLKNDLRSSLVKLKDTSNLRRDFPRDIKARLEILSAVFQTVCKAQTLLNTLESKPPLDLEKLEELQDKLKMLGEQMMFLQMEFGSAEALNQGIGAIKEQFETRLQHIQNPPPQARTTHTQAAGNYSQPVINPQITSPQDTAAVKQFYDNLSGAKLEQFRANIRQNILANQGIIPKGCDLLNDTLTIKNMAALSEIHTVYPQNYQSIILEDPDITELPETIRNIAHVESITIKCCNLESLKHIELCTRLKQLDISSYNKLMNCDPLALCSSIQSLKIYPFSRYNKESLLRKAILPPQLEHIHLTLLFPLLDGEVSQDEFQQVSEVMHSIKILDIGFAHRNFMNKFTEGNREIQPFNQLEALSISKGFNDNKATVVELLKKAPNLKVAHIDQGYRLDNEESTIKGLLQKGILVNNFTAYEAKRKEILGF